MKFQLSHRFFAAVSLLLVPAVFGETVVIESRQASGALTGTPSYQEFNVVTSPGTGNWQDTALKSAAFGLVGTGARFATNNGVSFTVTPTLTAGGTYYVEITHASSTAISLSVIADITQTGCSGLPPSTTAFQQNQGVSPNWAQIGTITVSPGVTTPSIKFTKNSPSGELSAARRWIADSVRFRSASTPISITVPPASQSVAKGSNATFTVTAAGTPPLFYQWRKAGVDISDATNTVLDLFAVTSLDEASYSVLVTNITSSATASATLTVVDSPVITVQPVSRTNNAGTVATFTVSLSDTSPFAFQWQRGGTNLVDTNNIFGATTATLIVSNVLSADATNYVVLVSNIAGTVSSDGAAYLTVIEPVITSNPVGHAIDAGTGTSFTVSAIGTEPLRYQWLKDGNPLGGATNGTFVLASAFGADGGSYSVIVSNDFGTATSSGATLSVNDPILVSAPVDQSVVAGAEANFTVGIIGSAPLSFQWMKNSSPISGATKSAYNIATVLGTDAGLYSVTVSNSFNVLTTSAATLSVSPAIITPPQNQTASASNLVTFTVSADGQATLQYQWQKDGVIIPGATLSSYVISSVSVTDEGNYRVAVSNSIGSVLSSPAQLAVDRLIQTIAFGGLSPKAYGTAPFGVTATSSSGLPVTFSVLPGSPATMSSNIVTITGAGTVTIRASQSGDTTFGAATNVDQSFTVTKVGLTATVTSTTRLYGAANPSFSVTYSGFVNGDSTAHNDLLGTPLFSTSATQTSTVAGSPYSITVTNGTLSSSNYTLAFAPGLLTITKAPVTVKANDAGMSVGSPLPVLSGVITGALAGDGLTATYSTTATISSPVGVYPINPKLSAPNNRLANYITNMIAGKLTITPVLKITLQPVAVTIVQGQTANMKFGLSAAVTPSIQWYKDKTNLVVGATATNLVIPLTTTNDTGLYSASVTVGTGTNAFTTNTLAAKLTVNADIISPSVTISLPLNLSRWTNISSITAMGIGRDNGRLSNVLCRLNAGQWGAPVMVPLASPLGVLTVNWSTNLNLNPGTNVLEVQGFDVAGRTSPIVKSVFFYVAPSLLTLNLVNADGTTDDVGTITQRTLANPPGTPTNQAFLEVNRPYAVTANPGRTQLFTNWTQISNSTEVIVSTNRLYTFLMQQDLVLNANFIHNPYIEASGAYNGLFTNANIDYPISGYVSISVSSNQVLSGKVIVEGDTLTFGGKFSLEGGCHIVVPRLKLAKSSLVIDLKINFADRQIVGTLTDGVATANIVADRAAYTKSQSNPFQGRYTLVLPHDTNANLSPGGFGYGTLTVSTNGNIVIVGKLGDGSIYNQTVPISETGRWPLYAPLYLGKLIATATNGVTYTNGEYKGCLLGWLNFTNNTDIGGEALWIKTTLSPTNTYYAAGFTNSMLLTGQNYVPPLVPSTTRLITMTTGVITLMDGNLSSLRTNKFFLDKDNSVDIANFLIPSLKFTFDTKLGSINGSFAHPNMTNRIVPFSGVVLQRQARGYGMFLGLDLSGTKTNQTGSISFK
ncbi:MAG: C-terminal target protein [Verrucomicrobiales bacterium]|nr:C-terminal target protein [Verrucomicrobiales bacterium]